MLKYCLYLLYVTLNNYTAWNITEHSIISLAASKDSKGSESNPSGRLDRFQRFSKYLSKPGIHDELLCAHQNSKSSDQCTEVTNNAHNASARNTLGLDSVLHHSCSSGSKLKKHKTYIHGRMSLGIVRRKLTRMCSTLLLQYIKQWRTLPFAMTTHFDAAAALSPLWQQNEKGSARQAYSFSMLIQYCYCSLLTSRCLLLCWCSCCCDSLITMRDSTCLSRLNFSPQVAALPGEQSAVQLVSSPAGAMRKSMIPRDFQDSHRGISTFIPNIYKSTLNQPTGQAPFFWWLQLDPTGSIQPLRQSHHPNDVFRSD